MKRKNQIRRQQEALKAYQGLPQAEKESRTEPNVNSAKSEPCKKRASHTEQEVLRFLGQRGCKRVGQHGIDISKAKNLGNGCWGRLDFLKNHCGFSVIGRAEYTASFKQKEA